MELIKLVPHSLLAYWIFSFKLHVSNVKELERSMLNFYGMVECTAGVGMTYVLFKKREVKDSVRFMIF